MNDEDSAVQLASFTRWRSLVRYGYLLGLAAKALDGILELAGGIVLGFASDDRISHWIDALEHHLVSLLPPRAGPLVHHALHQPTHATVHFFVLYLLIEGLIKLGLVAGLLAGFRRAYPVALIALAAFLMFQGQRLLHHYSLGLAALALLNLLVMVLIALEWRQQRAATAAV